MTRIFFAAILAAGMLHAHTQILNVGDSLPVTRFKNVFNHTASEINLRNMKGKLVILDFWGPTCTSCLQMFPKLDALQKEMREKVQIVLVNKQDKKFTEQFFKQHKKLTLPSVPLITTATLLYSYFPHVSEPFQVWIDEKGKIAYLTSGQHTTSETIKDFLATGKLPVSVKPVTARVKSLFDSQYVSHIKYYSYISTCIDFSNLYILPENAEGLLSTRNCRSTIELYKMAYNESPEYYHKFERPGRLLFAGKDSSKYFRPSNPELFHQWVQTNGYYYQLLVPENKAKEKYRLMQQDLDRYFDLEAKVIQKKVKCLVLTGKEGLGKLASKGGVPKSNFYQTDIGSTKFEPVRYYRNRPYAMFSRQFAYFVETTLSKPFVDSVNYEGNIDIELSGSAIDSMNITQLNKELANYGLTIEEKEVMMDVLFIKERE